MTTWRVLRPIEPSETAFFKEQMHRLTQLNHPGLAKVCELTRLSDGRDYLTYPVVVSDDRLFWGIRFAVVSTLIGIAILFGRWWVLSR